MKTELEIVNVVCSGEIPVEEGIDLEKVVEGLDVPSKPHGKSGKDIELEDGGITLYKSGKFIIRSKNEETLEKTQDEFIEKLAKLGFDFEREDYGFDISNFVGSGQLNRSVNLNKLSFAMGLEDTDYEGEQFSGLIYRGYSISVTIYSNGEVILLGADTREELEDVFYNQLVEDIQKYSDKYGV